MSESYERFLPVRSYPWISIGILGLIAGLGVYDEYFAPNASNSSQIQTNNSSLSVGALVLGLAITWAIILTPVIAASQKLRSFIKLFNFRFQWVDLAWGVGLLTANLILSYLWEQFCFWVGWIHKSDTIGNVGEFLNSQTRRWEVLIIFLGGVLAPIFEELFFRGLFYAVLRIRFTFLISALISAFCFAMVHLQGQASSDLTTLPIIFALGMCLAFVRERSGRIAATISGHMMINLVTYIGAIYLTK